MPGREINIDGGALSGLTGLEYAPYHVYHDRKVTGLTRKEHAHGR
jgi:hypothetical protein